ncbi:hypothetical protein RUND412_005248 [Rhizina undulata]
MPGCGVAAVKRGYMFGRSGGTDFNNSKGENVNAVTGGFGKDREEFVNVEKKFFEGGRDKSGVLKEEILARTRELMGLKFILPDPKDLRKVDARQIQGNAMNFIWEGFGLTNVIQIVKVIHKGVFPYWVSCHQREAGEIEVPAPELLGTFDVAKEGMVVGTGQEVGIGWKGIKAVVSGAFRLGLLVPGLATGEKTLDSGM